MCVRERERGRIGRGAFNNFTHTGGGQRKGRETPRLCQARTPIPFYSMCVRVRACAWVPKCVWMRVRACVCERDSVQLCELKRGKKWTVEGVITGSYKTVMAFFSPLNSGHLNESRWKTVCGMVVDASSN